MNENAPGPSVQARLYEHLVDIYNWRGVKRLAFTLGAPHSFFTLPNKGELARRLIEYLTRRNRLGCLPRQMRQTGLYPALETAGFDDLPCTPVIRAQAVFPAEHYFNGAPDYQAELAAVFSLEKEDVVITAVAADTTRLLVTLPLAAQFLDFLAVLQKLNEQSALKLTSLTLFETLSLAAQQTWQIVACNYPPIVEDGVLRPVITWAQAWQTNSRSPADRQPAGAETAVNETPLPRFHMGKTRPDDTPMPPDSPTNAWYRITARPDNAFLPQYQTGDYLLAQTDLSVFDFRLRPDRPVLVMPDSPIDGTIQAEPYGKTQEKPVRLYAGQPIAETEFVGKNAVVAVRLVKDGEPVRVPQDRIHGVILGVWQQTGDATT